MQQHYRVRGAPVIHDTIDNETIAINQLTGAYYSLEGPAALAWQLLERGCGPDDLATRLAAAYEADVPATELRADLDRFLEQLLAEELIVAFDSDSESPAAGSSDSQPAPAAPRGPYRGLSLQRYTDMEVLLLADPIHEVDDTGWPKAVAPPDR
jgi:hypothetical protein